MADPRIDKLGAFLMSRFRDRGIDFVDVLARGGWNSPQLQKLQQRITALPPSEAALVRAVAVETLDTALHDFLFALEEAADGAHGIDLLCDGLNAVAISDGLQGEMFGEDGWRARFSKHGEHASEL